MEGNEFDKLDDERRQTATVCEELYEAATQKNESNDNNPFQQRAASTVTEWIDGMTVQTIGENIGGRSSQASTGFAWSPYHHTLELFSLLFPLTLAWSGSSYNIQREKVFKKSLGKLFLWGDGFRGGKLEIVLDESENLRENVIECLVTIAKILLFKLAPKCLENFTSPEHQEIWEEIHDLEILVEKAQILTENEYESDGSSVLTGTEPERFSLETANTVKVYVECLMDLLPSMEETLSALEYNEFENPQTPPIDFQVSGPAQPYVLKVYDKFPKADLRLIHRLGEANWQRHMSLRKMDNQIEADEIPQEIPKAVFVPVSLFQDSGLSSSPPAQSTHAATTASYSSFQSTAVDKDNEGLRVPPTPKWIFEGVPFGCQICGHILRRIKNRTDWRRHVFADLKPYICTFSSCKDELKIFPTRRLWEEHEFGQHRLNRYWSCSTCQYKARTPEDWRGHLENAHGLHLSDYQYLIAAPSAEMCEPLPIDLDSCPLCLEVPGESRRNFATHVGEHMEAIALAALPREEDFTGSDLESMASGVSSTVYRRELTEPGQEGEPAQKGARRRNFSQFTSGTYEEEDEDISNTDAATHASTNTQFDKAVTGELRSKALDKDIEIANGVNKKYGYDDDDEKDASEDERHDTPREIYAPVGSQQVNGHLRQCQQPRAETLSSNFGAHQQSYQAKDVCITSRHEQGQETADWTILNKVQEQTHIQLNSAPSGILRQPVISQGLPQDNKKPSASTLSNSRINRRRRDGCYTCKDRKKKCNCVYIFDQTSGTHKCNTCLRIGICCDIAEPDWAHDPVQREIQQRERKRLVKLGKGKL